MEFIVTEKAMRPASDKRQCFYCQKPIGSPHENDCVLIHKKARVRFTIEYDVEVPASWDARQIDFHRNESSWCKNNAIRELSKITEDEDNNVCICGSSEFQCISDTISDPYLKED